MSCYSANPYEGAVDTDWHPMRADELPLFIETRRGVTYRDVGLTDVEYEARVDESGYVCFRDIRVQARATVNGKSISDTIELDPSDPYCRLILAALERDEDSIRDRLFEKERA